MKEAVQSEQEERTLLQASHKPFTQVCGQIVDPYQSAIEACYANEPELWKRVLGDSLLFDFGIYDDPTATLEEAGRKCFERQLELAGLTGSTSPPIRRVLDVGCGWGGILEHLAHWFPACPRFDGINVSQQQLEYCALRLAAQGLTSRVRLYQCNACNLAELPDPEVPYDLVIMRGCIAHFTYDVLEATMSALAQRMRQDALVVLSDTCYTIDLTQYQSAIPDPTDRFACGYRKTLSYLTSVLTTNGFNVKDVRTLPSNEDVIRWLGRVRSNIEAYFSLRNMPMPMVELHEAIYNLTVALAQKMLSSYSIIATWGTTSPQVPVAM